jgi:hypothetical protein
MSCVTLVQVVGALDGCPVGLEGEGRRYDHEHRVARPNIRQGQRVGQLPRRQSWKGGSLACGFAVQDR